MGISCTIEKEKGGHCTGWDGIIPTEIHIKKNTNGWNALKQITNAIPCESCSQDGGDGIDGLHDATNIVIGETTEAYYPKKLLALKKKIDSAVNACTNCHVKEAE
jgi:hypothetical protein